MSPQATGAAGKARARRVEILFALAVAATALVLFACAQAAGAAQDDAHAVATVARNGIVLETIDLAEVSEPYTLRFEDESGANVVAVEPGRIRVVEADCPDKVCVNAGWIDAPGKPIACVPHGITIVVEREGGGADGIDALAR
ncbi:hypothetical protein C1878_04165 [Gordonibacter sp. 28C]|uniref:NusG domain II-containing protein n=1 Tax=Gordonibacter sp. 28C TaxID=2078569 RepID=UPI000DF75025|nr:NusG domain II-containing protein [Gordonibacter sp. 28C]RDB63987.1 hypothetical protein C1878_04165 [Gordonibacter sp. 28C]